MKRNNWQEHKLAECRIQAKEAIKKEQQKMWRRLKKPIRHLRAGWDYTTFDDIITKYYIDDHLKDVANDIAMELDKQVLKDIYSKLNK